LLFNNSYHFVELLYILVARIASTEFLITPAFGTTVYYTCNSIKSTTRRRDPSELDKILHRHTNYDSVIL